LHAGNALASAKNPSILGVPASEPDLNYLTTLGLQGNLESWHQAWQTGESA